MTFVRVVPRFKLTSPAPEAEWREAMSRTPSALLTQSSQWSTCVMASGRWLDRSRLYELTDGRYLVLPLAARGRGRATVAGSWPYGWGYGGLLASDGRVTRDDVAEVTRDLARTSGARVSVYPSPFSTAWCSVDTGARAQSAYLTQVLDLSGGMATVWRNYSSNVRRSVRRAEHSQLHLVRDDTGSLLSSFSGLYRKSAERWARRAGKSTRVARLLRHLDEPPRRLEAIASTLGRSCVVRAAFLDGQPVAAIVLLCGEDHTLYWRGAMDRDLAARTHANALLHHQAIEEAVSAGHTFYSFGESDAGSDLATYKAKFGAKTLRWSAHHYESLPVTPLLASARRATRWTSVQVARLERGS